MHHIAKHILKMPTDAGHKGILLGLILLVCIFSPLAQVGSSSDQDKTNWPMHQHNAARTGQSPNLGISSTPRLLWQKRLPIDSPRDPIKGMITGPDGTLYILFCAQLFAVNPVDGSIKWQHTIPGGTIGTPAIGDNGLIYLGHGGNFLALTNNGEVAWQGNVGYEPFRSSPAIAEDGNVYFTHGALWSLTPDGYVQWVYPFDFYGGVPPAVGPDGTIYSGSYLPGLYAFHPDGSVKWVSYEVTPLGLSVGKDGTVYVGSGGSTMQSFTVSALNPNGALKWTFQADAFSGSEYVSTRVEDMSVSPDGTIYFIPSVTTSGTFTPELYAVNTEGSLKWKVAFPSLHDWVPFGASPPILDRAGQVYACAVSGLCYGVAPDGHILWEYAPLFYGEINPVYASPLIASDGRMFILNSGGVIHALIDPTVVPLLSVSPASISLQAESGTGTVTRSLQISSTVYPITWTAAITPPVTWISLPITQGITPGPLEVSVLLDSLEKRAYPYSASIQINSDDDKVANVPMMIPIEVFVGNRAHLPIIIK